MDATTRDSSHFVLSYSSYWIVGSIMDKFSVRDVTELFTRGRYS